MLGQHTKKREREKKKKEGMSGNIQNSNYILNFFFKLSYIPEVSRLTITIQDTLLLTLFSKLDRERCLAKNSTEKIKDSCFLRSTIFPVSIRGT